MIGAKGQAYYLKRFRSAQATNGPSIGWHWPAFFATTCWLLYRKMWGWALVYVLVPVLLVVGDGLVAAANGPFHVTLDEFGALVLLVYLVLPAMLANSVYLRHCNRLIQRGRRGRSRQDTLAYLEARGGTSAPAVWSVAVLLGFVTLGVAIGFALAVYDAYGKREKIVEALRIGAGARAAVAAYVSRQGTIPKTLEEAGYKRPTLPSSVSGMKLDPRTGTIEIVTWVSKAEMGVIYLMPELSDKTQLVWSCRADRTIEPFAPRSCREPD